MAELQGSALINCSFIPSFIPSGTYMLFDSTNAPTGWTKDTTHNDKALRLVSGSVATGGSTSFSTVFTSSRTLSGSTSSNQTGATFSTDPAGFSLTSLNLSVTATQGQLADISEHQHPYENNPNNVIRVTGATARNTSGGQPIASSTTGGATQHTHTITPTVHPHNLASQHTHPMTAESAHSHPLSTTQPFAINYRDIILASKT